MDILLTPPDPSFPCDETPYLGTAGTRWDGGPFLSYPIRTGNAGIVSPLVRKRFPELRTDQPWLARVVGLEEEEEQHRRIFQTWLFFGLIAEFTSVNQREDGSRPMSAKNVEGEIDAMYGACTYQKDGQCFLSGLPVVAKMAEFWQRIYHSEPQAHRRVRRIQHLVGCIGLAYMVLETTPVRLDHAFKFSIFALGEFLASSLAYVCQLEGLREEDDALRSLHWATNFFQSNAQIRSSMLASGWCVSDVYKMDSRYRRLATKHFVSRLKMVHPRRDHSQCTHRACKAVQVDTATYRPAHVSEACGCSFIDFRMQSAMAQRILCESDTYPVLRLEKSPYGERVNVMVEPHDPGIPYIALSHVWADGLGNPFRNELPTCQLQRLEHTVTLLQIMTERTQADASAGSIAGEGPQDGRRTKYRFWIDTLCCPVEAPGKRIALQRMAHVYHNAAHVLVQDSSFSDIKVMDVGLFNATLMIVSSSAWSRRLWTFQESVLAKSLCFRFGDAIVPAVPDLINKLMSSAFLDWRLYPIQEDIHLQLEALAPALMMDANRMSALKSRSLENLQSSLLHRSVSVASDEPLCVCALLSLEVEYVLRADDAEERTVRLWRLIAREYRGVPAGIRFHTHRKMETKGNRWIPQTLLASSNEPWQTFARNVSSLSLYRLGLPTSEGLQVLARGYTLSVVPRNSAARHEAWDALALTCGKPLCVRDKLTGDFFRIKNAESPKKPVIRDGDYRHLDSYYDQSKIRRIIERGKCAMIANPLQILRSGRDSERYLLVVRSGTGKQSWRPTATYYTDVICTHRVKLIQQDHPDEGETIVLNMIRDLAGQLAVEAVGDAAIDLRSLLDEAGRTPYFQTRGPDAATDKTIVRIQRLVREAFGSDMAFAQAAEQLGYAQWDVCLNILYSASYEIVAEPAHDLQAWVVD